VLVLEDPKRFKNPREAGSYIGLVPRLDETGESQPQLPITKAGNQLRRTYLVQSAQYILGPFGNDTDLRRWGLSLMTRGGKNAKKRAVIAGRTQARCPAAPALGDRCSLCPAT
jgi:transposase